MTTRANWFLDELQVEEQPDPFAAPIEEVGQRIDLRDPHDQLQLRISELLRGESNLFASGITCAIKDRPDTTCHACPVSKVNKPEEALSALCKLGRQQEAAMTELAVLTCREP